MNRINCRLFFALILGVLLFLSLGSLPVLAQPGIPDISVEPRSINVTVGSMFTVDVWIRKSPQIGLAYFDFKVTWDPRSVELINYMNHVKQNNVNWVVILEDVVVTSDLGSYRLESKDPTISQWPSNLYSLYDNASWVTLNFKCVGSGDSSIEFPIIFDTSRWGSWSDGSDGYPFDEYLNGMVHQFTPVGGVAIPVNKFAVLTPYLALAGLIIAVSTVTIIKKRKD